MYKTKLDNAILKAKQTTGQTHNNWGKVAAVYSHLLNCNHAHGTYVMRRTGKKLCKEYSENNY